MSLEDSTKLDALFYQHASKEGAEKDIKSYQEDLKQFSDQEDIKEIIKNIENKIINEEALTSEEKEIYSEYKSLVSNGSGQFIGISRNEIMTESEKIFITYKANEVIYESPIYREVLENVVNTINSNPEMLSITKEEFTKLLDTATNGNYSIVSKDIENGNSTKSELNAPGIATIKDVIKEQPKQVTAQDVAAAQERLNKLNEIIKNQQAEQIKNQVEKTSKSETVKAVKSVREYIESEGGISKGFQKFKEEKGL